MSVQGRNGLYSVITIWIGQNCHFNFTFEHRSINNYYTAKFLYPQINSSNRTTFIHVFGTKHCAEGRILALVFHIKVQSCESFKMCNWISFCTTLSFWKWILGCVLKLSDTILAHIKSKWLCSHSQLYKFTVGWIFWFCLFFLWCVNWDNLQTLNLIWLQEKSGVRDCYIFLQASSLFWLLSTVSGNTSGWYQWGIGKRKMCSVLAQKD